jgi:hypothetical protein
MPDCGFWPMPRPSPYRHFSGDRHRSRADVTAQYERARRELERPDTAGLDPQCAYEYVAVRQAVAAALAWVLGLTGEAPVSGRSMPNPEPMHIWNEYAATLDVREDLRDVPPGLSRLFVGAVEVALEWVQGRGQLPLAA